MATRAPWLRRRQSEDEASEEPAPTPAETPSSAADELRARREEIARMEERALRNAQSIEVQKSELDRRLQVLEDRERNLAHETEELKQAKRVQRRELERISSLTAAQAKQLLIAEVEQEARHQAGLRVQAIEEEAKLEAERRARSILSTAMQRLAATHASESTTRLVELPSDEMKGRIIGREGRNIRAFEALTGVDVIIDETPSAVVLSSFDGVRREIARITLERLIADGRIHPAQIEETFETATAEIETRIVEEGERAALESKVMALHVELTKLLGGLVSVETSRRAALLHDIGKAVSHEVEGPHALVGGKIARRYGEDEAVAHAMEAHHNEVEPRTVEAVIVSAYSRCAPAARCGWSSIPARSTTSRRP
jgi:ribonuclease Y